LTVQHPGSPVSSPVRVASPTRLRIKGVAAEKQFSTIQQGTNKKNIQTEVTQRSCKPFPGFVGLEAHRQKIAITDQTGDYLYEDIYMRSWDLAKGLLGLLKARDDSEQDKVCVMCDSGLSHVITTWACWMIGYVVVPLPSNPTNANTLNKLEHIIRDSGAKVVIASPGQTDKVNRITRSAELKLITLDNSWFQSPETISDSNAKLPNFFFQPSHYKDKDAMILYTSGQMGAGAPRGVVLSHCNLATQINRVLDTWEMSSDDTVLNCLNLHQAFSLVCAVHAPLSKRARVLFLNSFQEQKIWSHLLGMNTNSGSAVTVFAATPNIYNKLNGTAGEIFKDKKSRDYVKSTCSKKIRLMASSVSALPESVISQWTSFTGHRILNNFVCTEAGMVLSNRLANSTSQQGPACFQCGVPVDGIKVKLVRFRDETRNTFDTLLQSDSHTTDLPETDTEIMGELMIHGENLTNRGWKEGNEEKIKLYDDCWLHTADIVKFSNNVFTIKGKLGVKQVSIDGIEVSLGDIERKLLSSTDINDVTVVSLGAESDSEQKIAALLVVNKNKKLNLEQILEWCQQNLEPHMVPTVLKIVDIIPLDSYGRLDKQNIFNTFPEAPNICFQDTIL